MSATCDFCGRPVDPDGPSTYREISGWEQKRLDGGANAIHLRETIGGYAHASCIKLASTNRKLGIVPGQVELFGPGEVA